jgi:ribosomal protein S27AE
MSDSGEMLLLTYDDDIDMAGVVRHVLTYLSKHDKVNAANFVSESKKFLDEMTLLKPDAKKLVFGRRPVVAKSEDVNKSKRIDLIEGFIMCVQKYYPITAVKLSRSTGFCPRCKQKLKFSIETDQYECDDCGYCEEKSSEIAKDAKKEPTHHRSSHDLENFHKAIKRFQGKQKHDFPKDLIAKLDHYFIRNGKPTGEQVRMMQCYSDGETCFGKRGNTTKDMMFEALKGIGHPELYDHVNKILEMYWGWILPEIEDLEGELLRDYKTSSEVYESIEKERQSAMNLEIRLFKQLQKLSFRCCIKDFKTPETDEIVDENDRIWKIICDRLGWQFKYSR